MSAPDGKVNDVDQKSNIYTSYEKLYDIQQEKATMIEKEFP